MFKIITNYIKNHKYYQVYLAVTDGMKLRLIQDTYRKETYLENNLSFDFKKYFICMTVLTSLMLYIVNNSPLYNNLYFKDLSNIMNILLVNMCAMFFLMSNFFISFMYWSYHRLYSFLVRALGFDAFPPPLKYFFIKENSQMIKRIGLGILCLFIASPMMIEIKNQISSYLGTAIIIFSILYSFHERAENKLYLKNLQVIYPNKYVKVVSFLLPLVVVMTLVGVQYAILQLSV